MKKLYFFILLSLLSFSNYAQTVAITTGSGGVTGTSTLQIVGNSNYFVSESIYTDAEIGATNFITSGGSINKIGYYFSVVGTPTPISSIKIYMKNVSAATTTLSTGTYTSTGYTVVYSGPANFSTAGLNEILLTTPFVRTSGSNLEVLVERLDNTVYTGYTIISANGNNTSSTITTTRRYNGTTAPNAASSLSASAFRPAIELVHVPAVDAAISDLIHPSSSCYVAPQSVGVEIYNNGLNPIAPGAATVSYKIRGANTFNGSISNTTTIPSGGTEIVTFNGINLNNQGANNDTALVSIASDGDITNDTLYSVFNTANILTLPQTENAESATLQVFPYAKIVDGDRQLWRLQSRKYGNPDMSITPVNDSIVPRAPGSKYYLFDAYSGANSTGFVSRLYSNCIEMPASNATTTYSTKLKFWMTHDTVFTSGGYAASPSLDSMYVSVSTDKGVTWTRVGGFARTDNATQALNTWKQHEVILSTYNTGQSIQIGFEGASNYGNVIGLDDIEIKSCSQSTTTIGYPGSPFCKSVTTAQSVSITGTNGGTFTASPSGLSINANTGAITPSASTAGTYTVTYTIPASGDCPALTVNTTIIITALPTASISYNQPFCNNVTTLQNATLVGTTGGTYASGAGLSINATNGAINPSLSTPGTYTVTYTIAVAGGCAAVTATTTVTINAAPTATISYNGPYCTSSASQSVIQTGTSGGIYSATPNGLFLSASTGAIVPSSSTAGTYTVTYTVVASGGCAVFTSTASVVITANPAATISYASSSYCATNSAPQAVSQTGTSGGIYIATPSGLSINATTGAITPSNSSTGSYTVTYTVAAGGGCAAFSTTTSVTINAAPSASISYSGPFCTTLSTPQSVNQTGTLGGTYSATPTGLSINASTGAVTPSTSNSGNYTITYTIAATGGCSVVSATTTLSIIATPNATITYAGSICAESSIPVSPTLSGTLGGTYSSSTGLSINASTGVITPSASTPGTYTVVYAIAAGGGCSAFSTSTSVTINQGTFNTVSETACESYTWSASGQTYTTSGTYTHTYTNVSGCPSADFLNLTINNGTFNTQTQTACSSYTWSASGQTYTTSGTYTHAYTNGNGCSSADYLVLTIDNGTFNTSSATACNTYTWTADGQTYTTSGSYTHNYTNTNGCPSADYLNLTITSTIFNSISQTVCNSYTWVNGTGQTYTSNGIYTYNGTAVGGCDSIVYLNLTVNLSSTSSQTASSCNIYTWNGNTYTTSGVYTFTTTNAVNCDSVATLNLTINTGTFSTTTISRCQSYTWPANGTTYTTSGTYTNSYTNGNGCASADYLNLTIGNTPVTVNISESACDSYSWNGTTFTTSGVYTWIGTTTTGCDSIVHLTLTVNNSTSSSFTASGCGIVTLPWGQAVTTSGNYNHTYQTTLGCDSVVTANVTILQGTNTVQALTVSGPYTFHGQTYLESGSYTYAYTNANGCPSTDVLNLTVNAPSSGVTLYPNPNRGLFQIAVRGDLGAVVNQVFANVYDTRGRKLMSKQLKVSASGLAQVDLSMLVKGIYQIEIINENGKRYSTDKLIIQ